MGIGFALASGLVQGFTQNIGREMERRQGERERLDALSTALATASVGDNFNNKNVQVIQDYISRGYEQIDAQGGIDLFGTRKADAITKEDVSGLLGSLQTTAEDDDDDIFKMAGFEFQADPRKFSRGDSFAALADIANVLNSPQGLVRLEEATTDELNTLRRTIVLHKNFLLNDYEVAKVAGQEYDLPIEEQFALFNTFDDIYNRKVADKDKISSTAAAMAGDDGTGRVGDPTDFSDTFKVDFADSEFGDQYVRLASGFGFKDAQGFAQFWYDYTNISGMTNAKRQELLDGTAQLLLDYQSEGKSLMVDTGDVNFHMQNPVEAQKTLAKALDYGGDTVGASLILGAIIPIKNFNPNKQNARFVAGKMSGREYAAKILFGNDATEETFNKLELADTELATVLGRRGEGDDSGSGLLGLLSQAEKLDTPLAVNKLFSYLAAGRAVLTGLFGINDAQQWAGGAQTAGVLSASFATNGAVTAAQAREDQIKRVIDPATGKPIKHLTQEFLGTLDASVSMAYSRGLSAAKAQNLSEDEATKRAIQYAKFEASRIALAFQMARAADPSGRLSNQDIEAQLVRLGTNWDAPKVAQERILETIKAFQIQRQRFQRIIQVGRASGPISIAGKKAVKGTHAVIELSRIAGYTSVTEALDAQALDVLVPYDDKTMFYDEEDGNVYGRGNLLKPLENIDPSTLPKPADLTSKPVDVSVTGA